MNISIIAGIILNEFCERNIFTKVHIIKKFPNFNHHNISEAINVLVEEKILMKIEDKVDCFWFDKSKTCDDSGHSPIYNNKQQKIDSWTKKQNKYQFQPN